MTNELFNAIELNDIEAIKTFTQDRQKCRQFIINQGLCLAAQTGNLDVVKVLFRSPVVRPSVQYVDDDQKRAFEYAVLSGSIPLVQFLLDFGAFINWSDNKGYQPLHLAAQTGDVNMINFLIEKGSHVFSARTTDSGLTPLHVAADCGNVEAVRAFLDSKTVSVNIKTKIKHGKMTPLHRAVMKGHFDVVKVLCENGADLHGTDDEGRQAIHYAAESENPEILKYFIEHKSSVDAEDRCARRPIHYAIYSKREENLRILIQYKANIHSHDGNGYTPLYSAVLMQVPNLVEMLLVAGADPNVFTRTSRQDSCLLMAVSLGNTEVVQLLLQAGADPKATSSTQATALHKCQKLKGRADRDTIVSLLIKAGAKLNAVDKDGYTPLHNCVFQTVLGNFSLSTLTLLVQAGCHLHAGKTEITQNRPPPLRNSPLCWLVWRGFLDAADYLLRCGWDLSQETWMFLPGKTEEQTRFHEFMRELSQSVSPMSHICRRIIRNSLLQYTDGSEILTNIQSLPLPTPLKLFLSLQE